MKFLMLLLFFSASLVFAQNEEPQLRKGMRAPDFNLEDSEGKLYRLSSYKGKSPVVVYFYPKANTSGCTKQACGIRDEWSRFEENNIIVVGISTDSKEDIQQFVEDYNLNFPLLSDESKEVAQKYGVLRDNGMASRYTFIIDKKGKVAKVFKVTDIEAHSEEVFQIASDLN
jgi:thioredoxin-dependent peroxiredoxin